MSDIRRSLNNIDDIAFAVKRMVRRNEKLEADNRRLRSLVADVIHSTGDDPEIMAASRAEWAHRALEAEAKLAKAGKLAQKVIEQLRSYGEK